jgi:hypothetical protein
MRATFGNIGMSHRAGLSGKPAAGACVPALRIRAWLRDVLTFAFPASVE